MPWSASSPEFLALEISRYHLVNSYMDIEICTHLVPCVVPVAKWIKMDQHGAFSKVIKKYFLICCLQFQVIN